MSQRSNYQDGIIRRYYQNRDQIDLQRLSELVTSLYLVQGKKKPQMWQRAEQTMRRLSVPESRIEHVVSSADPALLASVVEDIQKGAIGSSPAAQSEKKKPKK